MKYDEIDPKEKIDTDLKKIAQLSRLLLDSDYKNYDAEKIFEILKSTVTSALSTYYFEMKDNE